MNTERRIIDGVEQDVLGVVLCKGRERWCVTCTESTVGEALRQFGRWASSPTLDFTWRDAALMSQRLRLLRDLGW